jgi:hypothetical protein
MNFSFKSLISVSRKSFLRNPLSSFHRLSNGKDLSLHKFSIRTFTSNFKNSVDDETKKSNTNNSNVNHLRNEETTNFVQEVVDASIPEKGEELEIEKRFHEMLGKLSESITSTDVENSAKVFLFYFYSFFLYYFICFIFIFGSIE